MTDNAPPPSAEDPPELDRLAERYLRLWQDQWAALLTDPAAAGQLARMAAGFGQSLFDPSSFNPGVLGAWNGMGGASHGGSGGFPLFPWFGTNAPDRPAPVPPAADAAAGDVDELTRRIADLEARLAGLERPAGEPAEPAAAGAAPKPRRRRPAGA